MPFLLSFSFFSTQASLADDNDDEQKFRFTVKIAIMDHFKIDWRKERTPDLVETELYCVLLQHIIEATKDNTETRTLYKQCLANFCLFLYCKDIVTVDGLKNGRLYKEFLE